MPRQIYQHPKLDNYTGITTENKIKIAVGAICLIGGLSFGLYRTQTENMGDIARYGISGGLGITGLTLLIMAYKSHQEGTA